ncbi:MAG: carbohydrate ABC transporter permease [Candidatus Limnocylindrales bacterium]
MRREAVRRGLRRRGWGGFVLALLVPAILWMLVLRYFPIGYLASLSLQNTSAGSSTFVGLANYQAALSDDMFRKAVLNTLEYMGLLLCIQIPLALLIAVGIDSIKHQTARDTILTLYFMPLVTSTVASAVVFVFLLHPAYGLFNFVLGSVGLPTLSYLQDPSTALPSVAIMPIWKTLGFPVIILLAGLQTISPELYDAAAVDGAGASARLRHVTLPLLRPTLLLVIVLQGIEALRMFAPVYAMTATGSRSPGGPVNSTMVWSLDVFFQAFKFNEFGYAAALAILMFVIVGGAMAVQIMLTRNRG